jgi:hypothetical protein
MNSSNKFNFTEAIFRGFKNNKFFPHQPKFISQYIPSSFNRYDVIFLQKIFIINQNSKYELAEDEIQKKYMIKIDKKNFKNPYDLNKKTFLLFDYIEKKIEFINIKEKLFEVQKLELINENVELNNQN